MTENLKWSDRVVCSEIGFPAPFLVLGPDSPILRQRYADVRLVSATSAALMMSLAFTQAC